jgi:hypothetical protein
MHKRSQHPVRIQHPVELIDPERSNPGQSRHNKCDHDKDRYYDQDSRTDDEKDYVEGGEANIFPALLLFCNRLDSAHQMPGVSGRERLFFCSTGKFDPDLRSFGGCHHPRGLRPVKQRGEIEELPGDWKIGEYQRPRLDADVFEIAGAEQPRDLMPDPSRGETVPEETGETEGKIPVIELDPEGVPVVIERDEDPTRCKDAGKFPDRPDGFPDVLQYAVDPGGIEDLVPAGDSKEISLDQRTLVPAILCLLHCPRKKRPARVQAGDPASGGDVAGEREEIRPRPAPGVEHTTGIRFQDDADAVLLDFTEERDTGDEVEALPVYPGLPGAVDIPESCREELSRAILEREVRWCVL